MKLFIKLSLILAFLSPSLLKADSISPFTNFPIENKWDNLKSLSSKNKEINEVFELMNKYNDCQNKLLEDENNKEMTCELIAYAYTLLNQIEKQGLRSYFSEELLNELQFLSSLAKKNQTLTAP